MGAFFRRCQVKVTGFLEGSVGTYSCEYEKEADGRYVKPYRPASEVPLAKGSKCVYEKEDQVLNARVLQVGVVEKGENEHSYMLAVEFFTDVSRLSREAPSGDGL